MERGLRSILLNKIIFSGFLLVSLIGSICFVYALDVQLNCPDEIFSDEETVCSLKVADFNATSYDIKFDILQNENRIGKIFDPAKSSWKSCYYFIEDIIKNSESTEFKIKVSNYSNGSATGNLKLRDSTNEKTVFEKSYELNVSLRTTNEQTENTTVTNDTDEEQTNTSAPENVTEDDSASNIKPASAGTSSKISSQSEQKNIQNNSENIINLNPQQSLDYNSDDIVYRSKNEKIKEYLLYGFCLLLILVIVILIIKR